MSTKIDIYGQRAFILITGASRGYGRALAIQLAKVIKAGSTLLLMARTKDDLKETRKIVKEEATSEITVDIVSVDLGKADSSFFQKTLKPYQKEELGYDVAVLIHNCGTLGQDGSRISQATDIKSMASYWRLNLFHVICLNSVFVTSFSDAQKVFVNLSSVCAQKPFQTWAHYCAGKAARDAVFQVLAIEEPSYLVLNWAPGFLDTTLIADLLADSKTDPEILKVVEGVKSSGSLLNPLDSAKVLVCLLKEQNFTSGDHVDYYDDLAKAAVANI